MWLETSISIFILLVTLITVASHPDPPRPGLSIPASLNDGFANRISFQDAVHMAVVSTVSRWPRADLVHIQATSTSGPTNDPTLLKDVRLIFALPGTGTTPSIRVTMSRTWGQWNAPETSSFLPPPRHGTLPWDFRMDIVEADALIKAAGYTGHYWWAEVVWPQGIPNVKDQLYYVFEFEIGNPRAPDKVFLGTNDRLIRAIYSGGR